MTRGRMLEQMGLGPVWVRRGLSAPDVEVEPEQPMSGIALDVAQDVAQVSMDDAFAPAADASPHPAGGDMDADERRRAIAAMSWDGLRAAVKDCTTCGLCRSRKQTVFGVGVEDAPWMLIGEAPGAEEDARGEPFVGQAGRLLDNMLAALDLSRQRDVYIANVLKCRPPGNRNPEPPEVQRCEPYLLRQVELVQPRLIVVLGRFAAQSVLKTDASIASLRGRVHQVVFNARTIPVVVTYHPAYLLRNLPDKAKSWADLCLARETLRAG